MPTIYAGNNIVSERRQSKSNGSAVSLQRSVITPARLTTCTLCHSCCVERGADVCGCGVSSADCMAACSSSASLALAAFTCTPAEMQGSEMTTRTMGREKRGG